MADIEEILTKYLEADVAACAAEEAMLQAFAKKADAELAFVGAVTVGGKWVSSSLIVRAFAGVDTLFGGKGREGSSLGSRCLQRIVGTRCVGA
ncbi:MAG TPA: hypothetical protein VGO11_04180 [Chthoniobacteraceae bacterium]|jgi:hypothetical protein|nr:hypothetical protein [Chthoniobacteraceae bacterium]